MLGIKKAVTMCQKGSQRAVNVSTLILLINRVYYAVHPTSIYIRA